MPPHRRRPDLFYGIDIPACILVLRQQMQHGANRGRGKLTERHRAACCSSMSTVNISSAGCRITCCPEHIEKIVKFLRSDCVEAIEELEAELGSQLEAGGQRCARQRWS